MLSRVADALYWMGRYLERSENITRLLLVTEDISSETQGLAEQVAQSAWKDLLAIFPSSHVGPPASAFAPTSMAYLAGFYLDAGNRSGPSKLTRDGVSSIRRRSATRSRARTRACSPSSEPSSTRSRAIRGGSSSSWVNRWSASTAPR